MSDALPIHLYLDEREVDDLWTSVKRDGIPIEKVREAAAKVQAKGIFKLGKLWQFLAADVSAEPSLEGSVKRSETLQYTAMLCAILLQGLVETTSFVKGGEHVDLSSAPTGTFVQLVCKNPEVIPIPTFSSFVRQQLIHQIGRLAESDADSAKELKLTQLEYVEKYTSMDRAFAFHLKCFGALEGPEEPEGQSEALGELWARNTSAMNNALLMSRDDHVLLLASIPAFDGILYSVLREDGLRRDLTAYCGNRLLLVFGRIANITEANIGNRPKEYLLVGICPITISLYSSTSD